MYRVIDSGAYYADSNLKIQKIINKKNARMILEELAKYMDVRRLLEVIK